MLRTHIQWSVRKITVMSTDPASFGAFQRHFPDDACAAYLASLRWPDGFQCPACGHDEAWMLETKSWTYECARCHKQTSITAGTVMHGSKLSLSMWFRAVFLMATHSDGLSASELQRQLGLGSYKTAWMLSAKLRQVMVDHGNISRH